MQVKQTLEPKLRKRCDDQKITNPPYESGKTEVIHIIHRKIWITSVHFRSFNYFSEDIDDALIPRHDSSKL